MAPYKLWFFLCQSEIQDLHHNRTNLTYDPIVKFLNVILVWNHYNHSTVNFAGICLDRLQNIYIFLRLSEIQNDFIAWHSFYIGPYVKMEK
jgi:hypothetical protein